MTDVKTIPVYQVDAFADRLFSGNPAAVCPLESWLDDALMQAIAAENNLSETAFFVRQEEGYQLRWFTPTVEVPLCGHATLASAFVIFSYLAPELSEVWFHTAGGELRVSRDGRDGLLAMSLPARPNAPCDPDRKLVTALGREPEHILRGEYDMAVYGSADHVTGIAPDMAILTELGRGVIVTAPAAPDASYNVISRFFIPAKGVPEDPVTGSAHCQIVPYWCDRLGRTDITAYQASRRGGLLYCSHVGDRVVLRGHCAPYMHGTISV